MIQEIIFRRLQYKRLFFGINSASEIFHNKLAEILEGLEGTINAIDDILIMGKNQTEHDKNVEATLKRLEEHGFTVNIDKCKFNQSEVVFYGLKLSKV